MKPHPRSNVRIGELDQGILERADLIGILNNAALSAIRE
jgi:hypothetical protein